MTEKIDLLLFQATFEDLGIYPRSVVKNGVERKRTDYQEGWNEAQMVALQRTAAARHWFNALPKEQQQALESLLDEEVVNIHHHKENVACIVQVNDTFAYATAQAELVPPEDLPRLHECWKQFDREGVIAWTAVKYGLEPLEALKTPRYDEAVAFLRK